MRTKSCSLMLLIQLLFRTSVTRPLANTCPAKQIQYGSFLCCFPIDNCGINHRIKKCQRNGEWDECVPCENGKVNLQNTSSSSDFHDECYFFSSDCPEESVPSDQLIKSAVCGYTYCKCDESIGYTGDPCDCTKVRECGNNTYLKDGHCVACSAGTSREGRGYGPCTKITVPTTTISFQTTSTQSKDASTIRVTTTALPTTTTTSSVDTKITEKNETDIRDIQDSVQSDGSAGSERLIIVGISVSAVILMILVILGVILAVRKWIKRQRISRNSETARRDQSSQHLVGGESPDTPHHGAQDAPPPYSDSPPSYHGHRFAGRSQVDAGPNTSGIASEGERQGAVPFHDTPSSQNPSSVESPRWPTLDSAESGPSTSGGNGSYSVHDDADRTKLKEVYTGNTVQADQSTGPQIGAFKKESSVIPVADESLENDLLLPSAPSLDPQSVENDKSS